MKLIPFILLFTFFCNPVIVLSQQSGNFPLELENGTIDRQMEFLFKGSSNYTNNGIRYKVLRTRELEKLHENILDSISNIKNQVIVLSESINQQENTIKDLKSKLDETSVKLEQTNTEKDNISLFGNSVSKMTYGLIMWTIIIGLLLLLGYYIFRFSQSNTITKEAKSKLEDLEAEYEEYRRKALEREQRISRQLHDEINKTRKNS
jgi:tetrahydromethanopterin S-methyltransferase subunit B